jgi:DnaK suppressor protein
MMVNKPRFDEAYLQKKRQQLIKLRDEILTSVKASEDEETDIKAESSSRPLEREDDAQRLDALEVEGNLVGRDLPRLAAIERALEKISEGTYGFSDESGNAIAGDRLDAIPFAVNTVEEQEARERKAK